LQQRDNTKATIIPAAITKAPEVYAFDQWYVAMEAMDAVVMEFVAMDMAAIKAVAAMDAVAMEMRC